MNSYEENQVYSQNNDKPIQTDQNLLTLMQTGLITMFGSQTNNPYRSMVIASIVMTIMPSVTGCLTQMIKCVTRILERWLRKLYYKILNRWFKDTHFTKYVEISYITDDKKINELYKAVHWYITNCDDVDYLNETPIKYTYENDLAKYRTMNVVKINKHISKNKEKEISYKNNKIKYSLDNELITIYTDRDRKRENYKITLSTEMSVSTHYDVIEKFCEFCVHEYFKSMTGTAWEQQIYINNDGKWSSAKSCNYRKLDTIVLKNGLLNDIKNDVKLFVKSEEWYKSRDIPYKRGYLFYGTPGTGKTSVIKGMSNFLKKHIHFLVLSNIKSDLELIELLKDIEYDKTILVIEDIDCALDIVKSRETTDVVEEKTKSSKKSKRKSKKKKSDGDSDDEEEDEKYKNTITLSGILNAIDGVFNQNGRILIMTTNKPEILDEALLRPGRIDKCYLFDYCIKEQIKDLYEMFYQKQCPVEQLDKIKDNRYSPAHITAAFMRYRDEPDKVLLNIDKVNHDIKIDSLIEQRNEFKYNSLYETKQKKKSPDDHDESFSLMMR